MQTIIDIINTIPDEIRIPVWQSITHSDIRSLLPVFVKTLGIVILEDGSITLDN